MIRSFLHKAQLIKASGCAAISEPNQVGGLTATASGTTTINLSWTADSTAAPNGATSYDVERSIDGLGSWSTIATGLTTNSYSDSSLSANQQRFYRVTSVNCFGGALASATANATTAAVSTPTAPSGFTATSSFADSVSLAWTDNSSGSGQETGFEIEVSTNGGTSYSSVTTTAADATSYSHTGRVESQAYLYRIRATNSAGSSSWVTASSVTTPAALTGFTATASSSSAISLSWTDKSGVETGFRIERSTDNVSFSLVTTTAANAVSHSDSGLAASTLYYYRIRSNSYNGTNDSAWYSASATTQSGGLSPSWSLDFSSGTPSGYTLTRASTGSYVDSSGYVASASTDIARLTHDSSGSRLGLLVEESRTNIFQRSGDFANAYWSSSDATTVSTVTSPSDPSNTTNAAELKETTADSRHVRGGSVTVDNSSQYTFSVFVKQNTRRYVVMDFYAFDECLALFDLQDGVVTATRGAASTQTMTDFGNGWWRISMTRTTTGTNCFFSIGLSDRSGFTGTLEYGVPQYVGSTSESVYVWGLQMEKASKASSYIPTTTATVTRSADLAHVLDSSITSWGDPGALVVHFYPPGQAGTILSTDDASTAQVGIEASTTTAARAFWSSGSTATGTIGSGVQKAVHYWTGSTSKFCINGGTVQSGTNNLTIANTDFVTLGAEATESGGVPGTFSQYANCIIRKVEFYSGTLTDANLQTITT